METFLGWPVVSAESCFAVIRSLGIIPWPQIEEPEPLQEYLSAASEQQQALCRRFGPKVVVARHQNPRSGATFEGFRAVFPSSVGVFALIDEMVPVTAEWKHGNDRITIVPVAGAPDKTELQMELPDRMRATALREWEEETGIRLKCVTPLSPSSGIFSEVRKAHLHYFPFLGEVEQPISRVPTRHGEDENLAMIAFPLAEWVRLLESPELWDANPDFGIEIHAHDLTYAALRKLGRLTLV